MYNRLRRDRRAYAALAAGLLFLALIGSTRYLTWLRGEWYAVQAGRQLAAGDAAAAHTLLEQARATDPANALRTIALADLELGQRRPAAADSLYRAALDLENRSLYSRAMRALIAQDLGQPALAESELAAFDGYWRARDDLYDWAWRHALAAPPKRVVPGDALALGQYAGFAPATPDLAAGRWTLGDGRVRLSGGCGALVLRLQGPAGRTATVEVEDWIAPVTLALDGAPQELRVPLGSIRECEYEPPIVARVRSATGLLDLERAPWYVGVAVLEARVEQ